MSEDIFILGIDPAKRDFAFAMLNSRGDVIWKNQSLPMSRQGFDTLLARLGATIGLDDHLMVAVETTASLDDNLQAWLSGLDRRRSVLRVNAAQCARFHGARPKRGKSDAMDALRIAEYARVYGERLSQFQNNPEALAMRRLVGERSAVVLQRVATINRLKDRLVISFPEFAQVFSDVTSELALAMLMVAPTAAHAARRRPATLAAVKGAHAQATRLGDTRADDLSRLARQSIACATSDSDGEAILFLIEELRLFDRRIARIESLLKEYRAQEPLTAHDPPADVTAPQSASIPEQLRAVSTIKGVSLVGATTLVLRSGGLDRYPTAKAFAAQVAACPEKNQTGSSKNTSRLTPTGDRRARSTLYLLTQCGCLFDPVFAFHKWRMQRKGQTPKQAICACMNRMARLVWTLANHRTDYDLNRAIGQVAIHHLSLFKTFYHETKENNVLWKKVNLNCLKIA